MKKVMVVAGGKWQVPVIRHLKNIGHYVINTNLYKNSDGFVYADESYVVDVLDKDENLKIARQCGIDAVTTDQSDIAVPTVAFIAEQLGLCGIGTESAELFTNKYEMRKRCEGLGFPTPKFMICKTHHDAEAFIKQYNKAVIKPPDSQGSRGVRIVTIKDDIRLIFDMAFKESKSGFVLVEEFIEGYELTVEGYKTTDRHTTLAISEQYVMPEQPQIASNIWYSVSAFAKHSSLIKQHNSLVERLGLSFGITHAEYKYHNGIYMLIEIAARGGGHNISSHIVPCISGVNVYEKLCNDILGRGNSSTSELQPQCSAVLDFFRFEPGIIKSVRGIEAILEHPNVLDAALNFKAGSSMPILKDCTTRAGYIIAHEKNDSELDKLLHKLKNMVEVEYEDAAKC